MSRPKLKGVVRVTARSTQVDIRIAEDVFNDLGWKEDNFVSFMVGRGQSVGRIRFTALPDSDDGKGMAKIRVQRPPRYRSPMLSVSAEAIGAGEPFDAFTAPHEIADGTLTIDIGFISRGQK